MVDYPKLEGDCWPTEAQTWLLRAALLPRDEAAEAWRVWRGGQADLEQVDLGSKRLFPLVYRNLRGAPLAESLPADFRGQYRKTWYSNQAVFGRVAELLEKLQAEGLATLVLKGAALALLYYRDLGARPMADFDILVPSDEALRAFSLLERLGWRTKLPISRPGDFIGVKQSVDFAADDGRSFDLHWHVLWDCCYSGADDPFWAGSAPLQVNQVATRSLNPTDQLLHVCVHGASLNRVPPVRWAADAYEILRATGGSLDWPRLIEQARRLRLSLPLRDTLSYLKGALDAPVPVEVVRALSQIPVRPRDRKFYRRKVERRGLLGEVPLMWLHYTALAEASHRRRTMAGFAAYLRMNWGLTSLWKVPPFVARKVLRRVKAVSAGPAAG